MKLPKIPRSSANRSVFYFKLAIGLALLVLLLALQGTAQQLVDIFRGFNFRFLFWLMVVALLLDSVSSLKWGLFIRDRGLHVPFLVLLRLYLVGRFFSNFAPSMVGGDLARMYLLGRRIGSQSQSAASVFMERYTGIVALTVIGVVFAGLNPEILNNRLIAVCVAIVSVVCVVSLVFLFEPRLVQITSDAIARVPVAKSIRSPLQQVYQDIVYFRTRYSVLGWALLYSCIRHLLGIVNVYVACLAIGLQVSFAQVAVVTPIIFLLSAIPVSPNNLGWWEWSFSVLFVGIGASMASGAAVGLILRGTIFLESVVGAVLFVLGSDERESGPDDDPQSAGPESGDHPRDDEAPVS